MTKENQVIKSLRGSIVSVKEDTSKNDMSPGLKSLWAKQVQQTQDLKETVAALLKSGMGLSAGDASPLGVSRE